MSDSTSYHLRELGLVEAIDDPRRCVPSYDCTGWDVLDVGCGLGQTLNAREFAGARSRHGIDPDKDAIEAGRRMFPGLVLNVAPAEGIPYADATFDLVYSRVALPYTNVPIALAEMVRVAKPRGRVWLVLHSWRTERTALLAALRRLSALRLLDRCYVVANSILLAVAGRCIRRPWSGTYESFQFPQSTTRLMRRSALCDVTYVTEPHFCLSGVKQARSNDAQP